MKIIDQTLNLPDEDWLPVVGWASYYEVSNLGRVRRKEGSACRYKTAKVLRQKEMKHETMKRGYLQVTLKNSVLGAKTMYVHRMVCQAFHGSSPDPLYQCCHGDGDSHNNNKDNLRWDTRSANENDRILHGTHNRGQRHGLSKLKDEQVIEIKRRLVNGQSARSLAKEYEVSQTTIGDIKKGRRWVWCELPVGSTSPVSFGENNA
jgi:hypothetical protein